MAEEEVKAVALPPEVEGEGEPAAPKPPVIFKKIEDDGHAGAHGGAWKIALADMMTAMMAFFLLMWLLGSTAEDQRQGIAEYFQPSEETTSNTGETGGSNGMFGGTSIIDPEGIPSTPAQSALMERLTPRSQAGPAEDFGNSADDKPIDGKSLDQLTEEQKRRIAAEAEKENVDKLEKKLEEQLSKNPQLSDLKNQVNFIREKEGLRIEIIDKANFSMFASGTAAMQGKAQMLIREVSKSLAGMPNKLSVKGHTDSVPFTDGSDRSNWALSIERAESTRRMMEQGGMNPTRFARIEGVADTAPFNARDPSDPRNRRISITVLYQDQPGLGGAP